MQQLEGGSRGKGELLVLAVLCLQDKAAASVAGVMRSDGEVDADLRKGGAVDD